MREKLTKFFTLALVSVLLFAAFPGTLDLRASASNPDQFDNFKITSNSGSEIAYLREGATVDIKFDYTEKDTSSSLTVDKTYTTKSFSTNATVWNNENSELKLKVLEQNDDGTWNVEATVKNLVYRKKGATELTLSKIKLGDAVKYDLDELSLNIPVSYTESGGTSSGGDDNTESYSSEIVIENIIVKDSAGERIDHISKDSPPFNVEILYIDYGLSEVDLDDLSNSDLAVYATTFSNLLPSGTGNKGILNKALTSSTDSAPRFRVTFNGLRLISDGSASISFRPEYIIDGILVNDGASTATIHQAYSSESSEEDDIPAATPYIIVSQYSYGTDLIQAGTDFTLNISYKNTSSEIPLENIVMTVTTPTGISIASASNTVYIDSLGPGATQNHVIELQARPNAEVGSHSVQIDFSYQYLLKKERKENKTTENIAVPVSQIDRFEVDPITEITDVGMVDQEAYITISFINRGKSTTYNISARAEGNLEMVAPSQHFGNLETGKSDTLEVAMIPREAGDMVGEVVVQYEDENTNQHEIRVPFSMYIEVPFVPDPNEMFPPGGIDNGEEPVSSPLSTMQVVLFIIGGILIMLPIIWYFAKRVKAKGSEAFDEDF